MWLGHTLFYFMLLMTFSWYHGVYFYLGVQYNLNLKWVTREDVNNNNSDRINCVRNMIIWGIEVKLLGTSWYRIEF